MSSYTVEDMIGLLDGFPKTAKVTFLTGVAKEVDILSIYPDDNEPPQEVCIDLGTEDDD